MTDISKINFNGSVYTTRLNLIANKKDISSQTGTPVTVPVAMGNIRKLIIDDNLSKPGISGLIVFNNEFDILSKTGCINTENVNALLLEFFISCDDIKNNDGSTVLSNVVQLLDGHNHIQTPASQLLAYSFEEVFLSQLKQQNIKTTDDKIFNSVSVGDAIYNIFMSSTDNKLKRGILKTQGTPPLVKGIVAEGDNYDKIIDKLHKLLFFTESGPGLVHLENANINERSINITNIGDITKKIIRAVKNKETDLSDYMMENFVIAPFESNTANFRENVTEKYTLLNPSYEELFNTKWHNYIIAQESADDISVSSTGVVTYDSAKEEFERVVCAGARADLPNRTELGDIDIQYKSIVGEFPASTPNLNVISVKNALFRSFVFDNTAISFFVNGLPARKPGYFIGINDFYKKGDKGTLNGLWYVIGVRHIFEGSSYTNEIIAVKFFTL